MTDRHPFVKPKCDAQSDYSQPGLWHDGLMGTKRHHYIKEWREFRGLTQQTLADRVEISRSAITKIEGQNRPYTQKTLEDMAVALNCEPADLLTEPPVPGRPESELTAFLRSLKRREDQATALRILRAAFEKEDVA
ncbi:MAG: helix-turn-helix transcriptional regulator [Rhodospirillaceae bacterium]|nr:helix-turn-helix transcriptional regulator [Rhodospirillaceae bacterium]